MKRLAFLIAFLLLAARPAFASDVVVVELFTSQGCDKCPPADVLLKEISTNKDVITLDWHVDYWDFMGWKDQLARPEHKLRQEAYNETMGGQGVVTPQFIIDGRSQVTGARKLALYQGVKDALISGDFPLSVRLVNKNGRLSAVVAGDGKGTGARVLAVWFKSLERIKISGGGNIGKTVDYVNVVTDSKVIGTYGGGQAEFPVSVADDQRNGADGVAILVEKSAGGPILGAAKTSLEDFVH